MIDNLMLYRKMRHYGCNFAIQSHQPGGGIGQTRFILDGKCSGRDIAGSSPTRAAKQKYCDYESD